MKPLHSNTESRQKNKIFLAGSRRFKKQIETVGLMLEKVGVSSWKGRNPQTMNRSAIANTNYKKIFAKIDSSNFVYVICNGGYVGDTVTKEILYANSRDKVIISSEPIGKPNLRALVLKVMTPEHFVRFMGNLELNPIFTYRQNIMKLTTIK